MLLLAPQRRGQVVALFLAEISGRVVRRQQDAERVSALLARQFHGIIRIDDGAGVDRLYRGLKDVDAFEKKRPFFREEGRETLIGGDYRLIGFDLREIGIGGKIEGHRRGEPEFHGQADV